MNKFQSKYQIFFQEKLLGNIICKILSRGQYVEKDCSTHLCPDEDGSDLMVDLNHLLVKTSEFWENDLRYHLLRCSHRYIALQIYGLMQQRRNSTANALGAVSIRKTVLPGMAIPMLKIRRPNGRLIFNMEITIRR